MSPKRPKTPRIRRLRSALYGSLVACADAGGANLGHLGADTFWGKYTIVRVVKKYQREYKYYSRSAT